DPRAIGLFAPLCRSYPQEVLAAGRRAYHRWAADTFGAANDRIKLVGDAASGTDMDAMLAELNWLADHGFVASSVPGMVARPELPALYDQYWEPFWSMCVDLQLAVVIHAGYGVEQAEFMAKVDRIRRDMEAAGRDDL